MNEIRELIDKLNYYTKYYDMGQSLISDKEWDDMYFKLQNLENLYGVYLSDSPTQKVNYQLVTELKKVQHNHPMLSLDKTKSIDEINSFIGNKDWIAMAKMDGLTCSLRYEDGYLVSAETRGNGIIGEDVTHNAMVIKTIPKRIDYTKELIVDGEIICTYKDFEPFSNSFKNPRNFAAGSIRLLDSKECANRNLTFIAWDNITGFPQIKGTTMSDKLIALQELGFLTVPAYESGETREEEINYLKDYCSKLGYPIDGVVYKYNSCEEYKAAGRTDHHFKGGLAYKFYDSCEQTELLDIEYGMSRNGILTPIAIFKEIELEGTCVNRASLFNISILKQTLGEKPFIGQKIWVSKRNQIIPKIEYSEDENGNKIS